MTLVCHVVELVYLIHENSEMQMFSNPVIYGSPHVHKN